MTATTRRFGLARWRERWSALAHAGWRGRWARRLLLAAAVILVLWLLGWLAVPPLLKWQLQSRGSAALGRALSIDTVHFRPWSLDLTLRGVAVAARGAAAPATLDAAAASTATGATAGAAAAEPLLRVGRLHANLSASSLWRRAPVVEALDVDELQLRVARLAEGHYDIDDLIERFTPRGDAPPASEPARFALYNLVVRNAQARFDDRPVGRVHTVDGLQLALPFVSNLPADVQVRVEPHLAFKLDGVAFDSGAQATPFAQSKHGELKLAFAGLDVQPYLGYLPKSLPLRPTRGRVSSRLVLDFQQPAGAAPRATLRGTLDVADLALVDARGAPLLAWRQMQLGLADVQPLAHSLAFGTLRIDGAQLHLSRDAQGRLALPTTGAGPKAAAAASAPASQSGAAPAPAWQLHAAAIEITDSRIVWNDASTTPPAALALDALSLKVEQVAWPTAAPMPLTLSATLRGAPGKMADTRTDKATDKAGANPGEKAAGSAGADAAALGQLALQGQASDREARLDATLTDLSLDAFAPYLAQVLEPSLHGKLAAKVALDWSADENAPRLQLNVAQLAAERLQLLPARARRAFDGTGGVTLERLALGDSRIDLLQHSVVLGHLELDQPAVAIARDAQGRFNAVQWLRAADAPTTSAESAAPRERSPSADKAGAAVPPWRLTLQQLTLDRGRLRWADATVAGEGGEPLRVDVDALRIGVQQFEWQDGRATQPARVTLAARIADARNSRNADARERGTIDWQGAIGVQPLQADGELRVVRFPVQAFERYFAAQLPVTLLRAEAGYKGRVALHQRAAGLEVGTRGDVLIGDVHVAAPGAPARTAAPGGGDELLTWQALALRGLKFALKPGARPSLAIAEAELNDFYAKLLVTERGRFNLQADAPAAAASAAAPGGAATPASNVASAVAPGPETASASLAAASAPAGTASAPAAAGGGLPIDLSVDATRLVAGRVDFSDHFVRPNYSAALTDLNGTLGALSSSAREMATLDLSGRVAGTGVLQISGRLNPMVSPPAMDIKASATDIELAPLSPYAGKYAGYAIERGKLSVDVAYKIDPDGKLQASNQLVLNQLTFGDRVDSPDATKLPVLLAVALLKDRNGVIDINLPVSGSLSDPQFSIGGIVVKLIVNLLVKALTAPFALLTGGGGNDSSSVEFAPGSAALSAAGRQTIDKVAKALADRPALKMTVTGTSDPQGERDALRRAVLDAQLLAERRREQLRAGVAVGASAASAAGSGASAAGTAGPVPALSAAERSRLLKLLYKQTELPDKPRNVLGFAKDVPDAQMEALLLKHIAAGDDAMRELAVRRGLAVRDALLAKGLPSERLFLAAPKLGGAAASGVAATAASAPATSTGATAAAGAAAAGGAAAAAGAAAAGPRALLSLSTR